MRHLTPSLPFPAALRHHAQGIRAAIFDVDGVLTDGTLFISEAGETLKAFHALDGHGLKLLAQGGITPIVITGRDSPAVRRRLKDLGVTHAVFGAHDKLAAAEPLLAQLGLDWPQLSVMGDDWPDLPLATEDHNVPTLDWDKPIADPVSRTQVETLRKHVQRLSVIQIDSAHFMIYQIYPQLCADAVLHFIAEHDGFPVYPT